MNLITLRNGQLDENREQTLSGAPHRADHFFGFHRRLHRQPMLQSELLTAFVQSHNPASSQQIRGKSQSVQKLTHCEICLQSLLFSVLLESKTSFIPNLLPPNYQSPILLVAISKWKLIHTDYHLG